MPVKLSPAAMFWAGLTLAVVASALLAVPPFTQFSENLTLGRVWLYSVIGLVLHAALYVGAALVAGSFVLRALQPDGPRQHGTR